MFMFIKPALAGLCLIILSLSATAQTAQPPAAEPPPATIVPAPAPVQAAPLPPPAASPPAPVTEQAPTSPPAAPAPGSGAQPVTPPVQAQPAPAVDPNSTLAGKPGDPNDVDEVMMPGKPALVIAGQTTWDKGFDTLQSVFARLSGEAARRGLRVAGRPLTLFVETDDIAFRYEAMLPVDRAIEVGAGDVRPGTTPAGRALRFMHRGPYEDIDSTYEGITAYLDAKGLVVRDEFVEEYLNQPKDASDPNFEINIYVRPR